MLNNYPGIQHRGELQGKLILPDPEKVRRALLQGSSAHRDMMPSAQWRVVDSVPAVPSAFAPPKKWRDLSRSDPAYTFLMVALIVTLLACVLFLASFGTIFAHFDWSSNIPRAVAARPQSVLLTAHTLWSKPFPGSEKEKYDPAKEEDVLPLPTPTPGIYTAGAVPLHLAVTSIPDRVKNNSIVAVRVTANQPGIQVRLLVTYETLRAVYTSGSQFTDEKGNATLFWRVLIADPPEKSLLAQVKVFTRNPDESLVSSQTVVVQVNP